METIIKNLKLKDVRVLLNTGLSKGNRVLICGMHDFKEIVGENTYEDLVLEEKMTFLVKEKKEKESLIEVTKVHLDLIKEKIGGLTGKYKDKEKYV